MTNEVKTQWQLRLILKLGRAKTRRCFTKLMCIFQIKKCHQFDFFPTALCDVVINISLMVSLVFVINEPGPCKALQITENLSSTYLGTGKPRIKKQRKKSLKLRKISKYQ